MNSTPKDINTRQNDVLHEGIAGMTALEGAQYLLSASLDKAQVPSMDAYPFNLPVCRNLQELKFHPHVTFFIGENGTGKSTILEAIAVALGMNAEGGSKNFNFSTNATHSPLHEALTLVRGFKYPKDSYFLRAESFYNVASEIERLDSESGWTPPPPIINSYDGRPLHPQLSGLSLSGGSQPIINSYGGYSLHAQSHGESFFALLMERFRGNGLYILDEPEAALSPTRQLSLLARLHELVRANSQFIIATHSPILMAYPDSVIYELTENGIRQVEYTDTEHYAVTREFLNHHEEMLRNILEGE